MHRKTRLKIFFIGAGLLLITILLISFFSSPKNNGEPAPPDKPAQKKAELSINNFHHTATQGGKTQWQLKARSAEFLSNKNHVRLTEVSVVFFLDSSASEASLTADKGLLDLKTNNMRVSGHVTVENRRYLLTTEILKYNHDSHIISTQSGVNIAGPAIELTADTLTVDLAAGKFECQGHVKGSINAAENF
ncbi:MAG: LPS export ABC transporter periplasmic protein LptC [Desulfobacterales bacterium]|nr:LPS export ABC transporter periplasmic protein LptC [Desulfobacterales bacterium]